MENTTDNDETELYDPWHDPILIKRAKGDPKMLEHLAREALARDRMIAVFNESGATPEDMEEARERLSAERQELEDYQAGQEGL
ncbi:MAG TPA: hypothetical protein VMR28_01535 [Candidatus Saccharimonadales bacterium]|nr:hypothetical protein [Candidatus Saccharimonadales bacterium]